MTASHDPNKLIKWRAGAAVAVLMTVALWSLLVLMLLLPRLGLSWLPAPFISGFLVVLALLIGVWRQRQGRGKEKPIPPNVFTTANERFHTVLHDERISTAKKPGPAGEAIQKPKALGDRDDCGPST
jgi:hypothetical protein